MHLELHRRSYGHDALKQAPAILLDSLGELGAAYGLARLAFVGGSLVPRGGQNMLEPAAQGVGVLAGLHTEDSRDQIELLKDRGLIELENGEELKTQLLQLMCDIDACKALGAEAAAAVRGGLGASRRCADVLLPDGTAALAQGA